LQLARAQAGKVPSNLAGLPRDPSHNVHLVGKVRGKVARKGASARSRTWPNKNDYRVDRPQPV
jgi:hypothetical protein